MDKSTIIGLALAAALVLLGMVQGDGTLAEKLMAFVDVTSIFIVGGGTLGAIIVAMPPDMLKDGMRSTRKAFFAEPIEIKETIQMLAAIKPSTARGASLAGRGGIDHGGRLPQAWFADDGRWS